MFILAGDIGGTKAFLQLVHLDQNEIDSFDEISAQELYFHGHPVSEQRLLCENFHSLEALILHFLKSIPTFSDQQTVDFCCLALPGPVDSDSVELTNLPWIVEKHKVMHTCQIERLEFINDFYAAALGIPLVHAEQTIELYHGNRFEDLADMAQPTVFGNRLVVGAGTGLGVAPIAVVDNRFIPQSSEGGHFDFAPISPTQLRILDWLWPKWSHVSYERLLSGAGLELLYIFFKNNTISNSYEFFEGFDKTQDNTELLKNTQLGSAFAKSETEHDNAGCNLVDIDLQTYPSAAEVSVLADQGDFAAKQAMIEFVTIYAAFIGAAALLWRAPGGVYIAGGIAKKIQPWLKQPYFKQAFLHKGRMTGLLENTPVYLITDEKLGLKGAMLHNFI